MKMKNSILIISIIAFFGVLKADETIKRNLNDYTGRYSFAHENITMDDVTLEVRNDSILKVEANVGTANLIFVKGDEFKIFEYEGRVLFIRDTTSQKVIGVQVVVPSLEIQAEGKKEE